MTAADEPLLHTPLYALHKRLGARLVPFAGYAMPVQYVTGILSEHQHVRRAAGLFDVSHMGQIRVTGPDCAAALEALIPVDIFGLAVGRQRYGLLTDHSGGILDDLMITRWEEECFVLVVNAARKQDDLAWLREHLPATVEIELLTERALLALQGPAARSALSRLLPGAAALRFMDAARLALPPFAISPSDKDGAACWVTCSGYTGEDGFELAVDAAAAEPLAARLLDEPEIDAIGLGARDSLRLEAGLCLYGHDIDTSTTPVEAQLQWAISPARRPGGARAGGYPGAQTIARQLSEGVPRRRLLLRPEGRQPVREGAAIVDASGACVGQVTSGGFGATVGGPVAMGYVAATALESPLLAEVRGKQIPLSKQAGPFVAPQYFRG